jgi:hypothetical protein
VIQTYMHYYLHCQPFRNYRRILRTLGRLLGAPSSWTSLWFCIFLTFLTYTQALLCSTFFAKLVCRLLFGSIDVSKRWYQTEPRSTRPVGSLISVLDLIEFIFMYYINFYLHGIQQKNAKRIKLFAFL